MKGDRLKNRNNLNLLIDVLLFVVLAVLAGIGWLMKYTLPPGRERILKYGENRELFFLGWDRHQWGTVHLVVALVMLGLLALHIVFHWKTILCMARNAVPSCSLRLALTGGVVLASAVLFLAAFVIEPKKGEPDNFLYRNARGNLDGAGFASNPPAEIPPSLARGEPRTSAEGESPNEVSGGPQDLTGTGENHRPGTGDALLNGRMTLDESAVVCGISPAEVRRRLGLPDDYPGSETLGRLRWTHGMTMAQIRDFLEKSR